MIITLALAAVLAVPQQAQPTTAPQASGDTKIIEMQMQRDQAALNDLTRVLSGLTEFQQWVQLQNEIRELQQQLERLKATTTPPKPGMAGPPRATPPQTKPPTPPK